MRTISAGCALLMFLIGATAQAGTHTSGLRDVTPIRAETGEVRILCNLGDLSSLTDVIVTGASLTFPVRGAALDRKLTLQIHPVTTAWEPGLATWSSATWTRAGGDFDADVYARAEADLRSGGTDVTFDISVALTEILEEERDVYGFVITVPPYAGVGVDAAVETYLGALSGAELVIKYRRLYSIPPGFAKDRGAHGGVVAGG